ncbi:MAG: hypothetical protein K6G64_04825 [Eubacterium sp.]|nr:hypothetical protein [Eubacterium sp.]
MRKIFKTFLAGATTAALVASLATGFSATQSVKGDSVPVTGTWTFSQAGVYANAQETEWGNVGYINDVTMAGTNEQLTGWKRGDGSSNQEQTATQASNGFTMSIENTGWDCMWKDVTGYSANRINPWSVQAINKIEAEAGHAYKVTFKAKASKKKLAYIAFGCNVEGTTPMGEDTVYVDEDMTTPAQQTIALGTAEKTFTFVFANWVSASEISTDIMLGAFDAFEDFAGNDISDIVGADTENNWNGTVIFSDFTVVDLGNKVPVSTDPTPWTNPETTTEKATSAPQTTKPVVKPVSKTFAQVKGVKAKNNKKGKVTVSWKKVTGAKKYQIKVGKKTYTSKAGAKKYVVKKGLKKGKTYKIKVRAAAANGYKAGKYSKTVKVKIKK